MHAANQLHVAHSGIAGQIMTFDQQPDAAPMMDVNGNKVGEFEITND